MYRAKAVVTAILVIAIIRSDVGADSIESKLLESYDTLLEQIQDDSILHQAMPDSKQVVIPTKIDGQEMRFWIRWRERDGVIQFVQELPVAITEDRLPAIETAIARIDFALSVPGVELDHKRRKLAYRMNVPFKPRGGIFAEELRLHLRATHSVAASLYGPLKEVAENGVDPVSILELLEKHGLKNHTP